MVLCVNTKDISKDLKTFDDLFDFSNLNEKFELFSNKNKKLIRKFKIETPRKLWIDELICLGNKMYSTKRGNDSKNKLRAISRSQSKKKLKFRIIEIA